MSWLDAGIQAGTGTLEHPRVVIDAETMLPDNLLGAYALGQVSSSTG